MATARDYDVIVIGAGIAGMVSAVTANGLGKRVAVIEKARVGGNCTNLTCVPSKALIRLSHLSRDMAHLDRLGLLVGNASGLDSRKIMGHIRSIVHKAYEKDRPETFQRIGIHVVSGSAAFADRYHVQVNGRTLSAEKFIIAAGTLPLIPPIKGLHDIDFLTNETLYQLDDLPKSLIVLGGGVDGLEYASAFGRLGVQTTVVEMATRLLPAVDREVANYVVRILRDDGIALLTGTRAVSLSNLEDKVSLEVAQGDGQHGQIVADRVLVAIGRKPDLDGLSLKNAGVHYGTKGIVTDSTLRTSAPNIYACGDVVGPYQLASTAEYQGIVAATNAVLPIQRRVDYRNNVNVIFTEPPLAWIGLTEEQAHKQYGYKLKVYRFDYATMRRAFIDGTEVGMGKFLCDGRGRIVGAHIVGEAAGEVIHEAQVIKALNTPLHKLNAVTHAYPTYAQALVGRASQLAFLDRMGRNFFVRTALSLLPGYANRLSLARDRLAESHPDESTVDTATIDVRVNSRGIPSKETNIKAAYRDGRACVIALPAELTDFDEGSILYLSAKSGTMAPHAVILNFSHVRRMNGLGAAMLLKLTVRVTAQGRPVMAFGVTGSLRDVFAVTELNKVIRMFESETEALMAAGIPAEHISAATPPESGSTVDAQHWAKPVSRLMVPSMPKEARNLNVDGRGISGPVNGFGQLWQKIFRLSVSDPTITPAQSVAALKQNFPDFQPAFNRLFPSPAGIQPGEIVLIDASTPGGPVSTGVMVLYADERSFTFVTPQGHPECGWISFGAYEENGKTIVQILGLARAGDPVYEAAFHLIGSRIQNRIWIHVLTSLAAHLGVPADITIDRTCVDPRIQWAHAGNVRLNAQIGTLLYEPVRWRRAIGTLLNGKRSHQL